MLAKILMYRCYVEKFQSEGNKYVKKLSHFHCKCKEEHLLYVLLRKKHPHGYLPTPEIVKECTYATASANDICNFCIQIKYLLNLKCDKICLEIIPVRIQDELITTCQFLRL